MATPQANLLHSLTSLDLKKCAEAPFGMIDAQAVCLHGKVYIGGGNTPYSTTDFTILCYDPEMKSWKTIKSPTCWSALTTYKGKLVLLGGKEADTRQVTNRLWSLQNDDGRWTGKLLPMPTSRCRASVVNIGSHLIVAGGFSDDQYSALNVVEIFDGCQWTVAESLPKPCSDMKSTLHDGEWYLMGGVGQERSVFCVTVDSLIATAVSCEGEDSSVWKTLPDAPLEGSSIVIYGTQLFAIGGEIDSQQSGIYGYIAAAQSWVYVGDLPESIESTCSVILPSRELLLVGESSDSMLWSPSLFKATVKGFLCDVDIVSETSLEVTSQAHTYQLEGFGVKIHIPQNSLPAGCQQCRMEIRVSLSGHYKFSTDSELVSGIYWIYCPVRFCRHVTLEVQHCSKQIEGLSFVRADCTQEQLPYTFQRQDAGVFSESSSYGSIELSHFSGWAILASLYSYITSFGRSANRQYWAQVCYRRIKEGTWDVHFVVTWNVEAHIIAARNKLENKTDQTLFTVASEFEVVFDDFIELDIPRKGLSLDGWNIKPLYHPRITRRQVDTYEPGRSLQYCTLRARNTGTTSPLMLHVVLKGASEDIGNYFNCEISEDLSTSGTESLQTPISPLPLLPHRTGYIREDPEIQTGSESLTDPPKLENLMEEVAAHLSPRKWADLATMLGLTALEIEHIEVLPNTTPNCCYREVFSMWERNTPKPYCWATIVEALKSELINEPGLACSISKSIKLDSSLL